MTDLEKFEKVNSCETVEELQDAILSFADEFGEIEISGNRKVNAETMSNFVSNVVNDTIYPNMLTRRFGIRQQALYLKYCLDRGI